LSDILRNVTFNTIYKAKSLALSKCLSFQRPQLYLPEKNENSRTFFEDCKNQKLETASAFTRIHVLGGMDQSEGIEKANISGDDLPADTFDT
jgi:hypothetical protein